MRTSGRTWPSTSWRGRRRRPPSWTPRAAAPVGSRTLSATRTRTRPSRATRVKVDVILDHAAKALVLSLAWYSTDQEGNDVAALLELVWRDAPMPVEKVFSKNPNGRQRGSKAAQIRPLRGGRVPERALHGVRARVGRSDSWTYHDRRAAVAVGPFANVVQRCRDGPMLPYLLFYDALPAPAGELTIGGSVIDLSPLLSSLGVVFFGYSYPTQV